MFAKIISQIYQVTIGIMKLWKMRIINFMNNFVCDNLSIIRIFHENYARVTEYFIVLIWS